MALLQAYHNFYVGELLQDSASPRFPDQDPLDQVIMEAGLGRWKLDSDQEERIGQLVHQVLENYLRFVFLRIDLSLL